MRLGLVGCGWITELCHLPAIAGADDAMVVAVADLAPNRAQLVGHKSGLTDDACFSDYRALLERSDVDVVSVATPPSSHREIVVAAAQAGKHVLCEKPIATTLADADAMIAACEEAGVMLAMYHNYLYFWETKLASQLIKAGEIGQVIATELCGYGGMAWAGTEAFQPGWRSNIALSGGGTLMDSGVHAIYLTQLYQGREADSVSALMRYGNEGVDHRANVRIGFGEGVGLINTAWGQGGGTLSVMGTDGHIAFVFDEGWGYYGLPARAVRLFCEGKPSRTWYPEVARTDWFFPEMFQDLAATIEGQEARYPATGQDARNALEIALASYESDMTGKVVELPLASDDPVAVGGLAGLRADHSGENK